MHLLFFHKKIMTVQQSTCEHFHSMLIEINQTLHHKVFPQVTEQIDSEINFQEYLQRPIEDHLLFANIKVITDCNTLSLNEYYGENNPPTEEIILNVAIDTVDESILYQKPNSDSGTQNILYNEDFLKEMLFSSVQISDCFVKEIQTYNATDRDQIFTFLESTGELSGYNLGLLVYAYRVNNAQPSTQECSILVDKLLMEQTISFTFLAQGFLKNCDFSNTNESVYAEMYQKVNETLKNSS